MKKTKKRSKHIRLFLLGGLSAGALAGCSPAGPAPVSADNAYTNNFYLPGAGYYHAPFRAWYPHPYNYYDPQKHLYYFGGLWGPDPHQSITNISSPSPQAASSVQAIRTDIARGGFGCTGYNGYSHGYYIHS
ncbi:MAG TPA: hypothetical protein VGO59_03950 [Verrucomicrobiae bacterium]|jgi:hypothetical protein